MPPHGRISRRLEDELQEEALIKQANLFFNTLVDGFKDLAALVDGSLTVPELRERSLLGSPTMYRAFAGAYYDLLDEDGGGPRMNRLQVIRFFESLAPFMAAPVKDDSPWVTKTQQFPRGSTAPIARREDLKALTAALVAWAIAPPDWLKAA